MKQVYEANVNKLEISIIGEPIVKDEYARGGYSVSINGEGYFGWYVDKVDALTEAIKSLGLSPQELKYLKNNI